MKKNRRLFLLLITLFIFSGSIAAQSKGETTKESTQNPYGLSLNDNNKWEIDKKMMTYLSAMDKDINAEIEAKLEKYHILANSLVQHVNALVTGCTMDGPAHDELHKWLVPYIETVNQLNECENLANAQILHAKLKTQMQSFNKYFK